VSKNLEFLFGFPATEPPSAPAAGPLFIEAAPCVHPANTRTPLPAWSIEIIRQALAAYAPPAFRRRCSSAIGARVAAADEVIE